MTTHVLKPLAIALLLGVAPLSISTAYAVAAVTGPAGPTGATGAKGDTGLPGAAGTNGLPGATGATGATGLTGAAGAKGINGTNGATGAQGLTGAIGPSGGVKGDTGATGAAGAKGDTGLTGLTGLTGATGPAGAAGTGSAGGSAAIHFIGDSYAGGIVFWVDASGEHGLIAARADQSVNVTWYNNVTSVTGTTGNGIYSGAMNTAIQVTAQLPSNINGNFAAKVAADYSVQDNGITPCTLPTWTSINIAPDSETCYGDWYLPSQFELNLLYRQKVAGVVGNFSNAWYWSSTELHYDNAWDQNFGTGVVTAYGKGDHMQVRAIRAF